MNRYFDRRAERWIDRACWLAFLGAVALVVYAGWTVYESQVPRAVLPVTPAQMGIVTCLECVTAPTDDATAQEVSQ